MRTTGSKTTTTPERSLPLHVILGRVFAGAACLLALALLPGGETWAQTVTGRGTPTVVAKFTGPSTIGDSVITESAGRVGIGSGFDAAFAIEQSSGSPNAGYLRFGDSTGWKLHFGRSREASAGRLNTGTRGVLMTIQDNGNVGIGTGSPRATLDVRGNVGVGGPVNVGGSLNVSGGAQISLGLRVSGGCSGCDPSSDRDLKANFSSVNRRFILDRLATIPIQTWNYKSELASVRHIGAMAQDFHAAFKLGTNDTTLHTVDAQGVTMAAIQGLYQMGLEQQAQIEAQQEQLTRQQQEIDALTNLACQANPEADVCQRR